MLVRPVMKRLFCLKSKNGLIIKVNYSANNTRVPDILPLPTTNATYIHIRVANLLGSFYELSTSKLIYTGCTAAYAAPCRTALSFVHIT